MSILSYMPQGGGVKLPELSSPASADDIAYGKEAINEAGEVISGNVPIYGGVQQIVLGAANVGEYSPTNTQLRKTVEESFIARPGNRITLHAPMSDFGDATAADVAARKTFTSNAGLKVTGTASPNQSVTVSVRVRGTDTIFYSDANGASISIVLTDTTRNLIVKRNTVIASKNKPIYLAGTTLTSVNLYTALCDKDGTVIFSISNPDAP